MPVPDGLSDQEALEYRFAHQDELRDELINQLSDTPVTDEFGNNEMRWTRQDEEWYRREVVWQRRQAEAEGES